MLVALQDIAAIEDWGQKFPTELHDEAKHKGNYGEKKLKKLKKKIIKKLNFNAAQLIRMELHCLINSQCSEY